MPLSFTEKIIIYMEIIFHLREQTVVLAHVATCAGRWRVCATSKRK